MPRSRSSCKTPRAISGLRMKADSVSSILSRSSGNPPSLISFSVASHRAAIEHLPDLHLAHNVANDPAAHLHEPPAFFEQRQENGGWHKAVTRMVPAQESFGAD